MKIFLIVMGVIAVLAVVMAFPMFYGMNDIRALVIRNIDLSQLADGTYTGSYHKGRWTYDVEVTIRDHRIAAVKNTNPRTKTMKDWNDKAEALILAKQGINVDVVSGASINTKAFEKAVEIALSGPAQR